MNQIRSIVVATDFSEIADNAVRYSVEAAKVIGAKVVLFNLYELSSHAQNSIASVKVVNDYLDKQKTRLKEYAAKLSQESSVVLTAEVRMGDFLEEVKHVIDLYAGDILVMGMPRKSFEQDLLGNTTTETIYKMKFPILSVPANSRFQGIKRILYACDFTRGVHRSVLDKIKGYATSFGAEVEVLYVSKSVKEATSEYPGEFENGLDGVPFSYKTVQSDTVIGAIRQEAGDISADLLVMTPHKYGFWSSLLHVSKTREMASNGEVPLLSVSY